MKVHPRSLIPKKEHTRRIAFLGAAIITLITLFYAGFIDDRHGGQASPGSLTATINQKAGTSDSNPSYVSVFTVVFSEPIKKDSFTAADITLGGTATGQSVQSITEAGSFNATTFEVRIVATGAGTIAPSVGQELVSAINTSSGTNQASTSTDNSVTYNGSYDPGEFIFKVKTDNPGSNANNEFLISSYVGTNNYTVDCNNDGSPEHINRSTSTTCVYGAPGEYVISITGTMAGMSSYGPVGQKKVLDVLQWGTMQWETTSQMFESQGDTPSSFQISALDAPNLSAVTNMSYMFSGAGVANSFNSNINHWDTSNIVWMQHVFKGNRSFNQPLNNWDVSNVLKTDYMFYGATAFNQPLDQWVTASLTTAPNMFSGATSFDQSLATWDVSNVADMTFMFGDGDGFFPQTSGLSIPNYDATLIAWSQQNLEGFVTFDAGTSKYCSAEAQRQYIIDDKFWTINDSGKDCTSPLVTTRPATNVVTNSATLNGTTSPTGVTERGFEYGLDTNYGQSIQDTSPLEYTYASDWGSTGTGDGQFSQPPSIATDSQGNVYVADSENDRIQKFTSSGDFILKWGTEGSGNGELNNPTGVVVDSVDNVYVVDRSNHRVQKFDSDGSYIAQWGTQGNANNQFDSPFGIAVDSQDNIYVTDVGNERVQKFNSSGTYLATIGSEGSGDGQFEDPYGIAADSQGNIYVMDINYPTTRVQKFDSSGAYLLQWGTLGSGTGQFNYPIQVAINAAGYLYVSDLLNNRVQKFTTSGVFESVFASNGTGNGQVQQPSGIAFNNSEDFLYIISSGSGKLMQFTQKITANLSSLTCETTYHFRAYATVGSATTYGDDETLITDDCPAGSLSPSPSTTPSPSPSSSPSPSTAAPTSPTNSPGPIPSSPQPTQSSVPSSSPDTNVPENVPSQPPTQGSGRSSSSTPRSSEKEKTKSSTTLFFGIVPESALNGVRLLPQPVARTLPFLLILILFIIACLYARQAWLEYRTLVRLQHILVRYRNTQEASKNFVALTSHYLNTPVNILQASVELITTTKLLSQDASSKLAVSIENLTQDVKALVTDSQLTSSHVADGAAQLDKLKVRNPFMSAFVILPILVVGIASIILNALFTATDRYSLDSIMLVGQIAAFILAAGLIMLAWRSFKRNQARKDMYKQQVGLEHDLLARRVEFIEKSFGELSADVGLIQHFGKAMPPGTASAKPFFNAIVMLEAVLAKFESFIKFSKPIEQLPAAISVRPVIEAAFIARKDILSTKQVRLVQNIPVNITARLDTDALNQLIDSLIDNAVKFSQDGGEVSVIARITKGTTELIIKDTGIGIEPSKLSQLMMPFSRATDVMQFDYEGIGLSLYLNKVLLEQAGGQMTIQSTPGKGTTVTVILQSDL